jgi:hypothetical protein
VQNSRATCSTVLCLSSRQQYICNSSEVHQRNHFSSRQLKFAACYSVKVWPHSAQINGHAERDLSPKWSSDFYLLFLTTKRNRRGHVLCLKSSFAILRQQKTHICLLLCVKSLPFNLYQSYCLSLLKPEIM